ncbi:MAG TPA: hypothetical protein VHL09_05430, partial [Dehalococcoidia bacterium]|nr:hypothetical protein [Dehalococcoidia bacterium]
PPEPPAGEVGRAATEPPTDAAVSAPSPATAAASPSEPSVTAREPDSGPSPSPTPDSFHALDQAPVLALPRLGVNGPIAGVAGFDQARSLGARVYAVGLMWFDVEPSRTDPPTYDWTKYDAIFRALSERGLIAHVIVTGNPRWAATGERKLLTQEGRAGLAEFAGALAGRYPDVTLWSFYNEPDCRGPTNRPGAVWESNPSTCWGEHGHEYAEMLAAVRPAVKAANDDAQILLGGLAHEPGNPDFAEGFLDAVLDAGGGAHFDVLDFHHYAEYGPEWTQRLNDPAYIDVAAKLAYLRQKMADKGVQKPIIISEISKHGAIDSDETDQARYLIKAFARSLAVGSSATIWFNLQDDPNPGFSFGLARADWTDKPAGEAFRTLAQGSFKDVVPDGAEKLEVPPEAEAYRFRLGTSPRRLIAGWTEAAEGQPLELRTRSIQVESRDAPARTVNDADDGEADGWVRLTLSQEPIIVTYTP